LNKIEKYELLSKKYIKKEADKGFTTRKNNCKIGTKNILPEYKKRIKNFL